MKLSMWILADWLNEYTPELRINTNEMNIVSVRLYCADLSERSDTLYIGTADMFDPAGGPRIVCKNKEDVLLLESENLSLVLNDILNAFDYYSNWENQMHKLSTSDCMLADLLDLCQPVIRNPLFVLDSGLVVLGMSSGYKAGTVDPVWDTMLMYGTSDIDQILEFNVKHAHEFRLTGPYQVVSDVFPHNLYSHNLFIDGGWMGILNIVQLNPSNPNSIMHLMSLIIPYLTRWIVLHADSRDIQMTDSILARLLSGEKQFLPDFERRLKLLGWNIADEKILLKLVCISENVSIHVHFCKTLRARIEGVYAIVYDNSVVILADLDLISKDQLLREIVPWLRKSGYYGGISQVYKNLDFLVPQYIQAQTAAENCTPVPGSVADSRYHMMSYTYEVLSSHIKTDICHPDLIALAEYDHKHNSSLSDTLYQYLRNERNLVTTAKALNIHRNSLVYRIKRLNDLLSADLNDADTRLHLLFSYEYSLYQ